MLGGAPASAVESDGGVETSVGEASALPADEASKGKAFWEDDGPPAASAELKASRKAVETKQRVEVQGLTSETNQVFANPDGTFTAESSAGVERVRKGDVWAPVDTTLVRQSDGTLAPRAAHDVALSGGGQDDPLVRFERDGRAYEVFSPWPLPEPMLDGSHAVYKAVRPDVDLVVQVLPDGFTQNLVVHTPEAAAALGTINYPVKTEGLQVRTEDSVTALVDDGGRPAFISGAPLMWDSGPSATVTSNTTTSRTAAASSADAAEAVDPVDAVTPHAQARTALANASLAADKLTLVPDQEFLTDPDISYPIVIDPPTVSAKLVGWTSLWSNSPGTSFWNTSHALGVGYDAYVDNKKVRSLFQFDTRAVAGKKILNADFSAYEIWSANCTKKDIELWRTSTISSARTWSSPPSWKSRVDTVSAAKGYSASCPDGSVEFDATAAVAYTAKAKDTTTTLGLRADETDPIAWKQFMSPKDDRITAERKPKLSITYVSVPNTAPSNVKLSDPKTACSASTSPAYIRDTTPTMTATPTSADGSNAVLRPNYELYTEGSSDIRTASPSAWTASGTANPYTITSALVDGTTYHFRARTQYKYTYNGTTGYVYGPWSASCYFRVDNNGPLQPTVTSVGDVYPECAGETCASSPETGSVGMTGQFKITAGSSDVRRYVSSLNGFKVDDKTYSVNTTSHTVSITPNERMSNLLRVETYDAAGNRGTTKDYLFNVAKPSAPIGTWKLDENTGTTAANSQGTSYPLTLNTASWAAKGRNQAAWKGTGSSYAATTGPVVNTSGSFAISAWAKLDRTDVISTVANQNGTNVGAFQLYYSASYGTWVFNRYDQDVAAGATIVRAIGTTPPVVGAWTHLLGVYDRQEQELRLYVNGRLEATTAYTTPWAANGPFEIGRMKVSAGPSSYFNGELDQVQAYNRVVFPDELAPLVNLEDPATGQPRAELLAHWQMDETSGTSSADATGRGNTLTLQPGAAFTTTADYGHGNVVELDEPSGGHLTAAVPVDESGSFTVAGWVNLAAQSRLEDTTRAHSPTVFAHPGQQRNSFRLWYRQEIGQAVGDWNFGAWETDVAGAPGAFQTSDEVNPPSGWIHVVGVYDSANRSAKLYVTGERQGAEEGVLVEEMFQPTGPLMMGRSRRHDTGTLGNPLPGQLDEMRVYAGVLSEQEISELSKVDEPPVDIG
ncbi:LamG-like jellyroll fold domain-containing protein [Streptomyces cupreus]|uniref:LamG-like jellyroll fold domain-containing protein n=1 Tax=Streptomyces cupreus TaxID=2759956 RepID=UPI0021B471E4|nr:LamG-like jellyroll fold domain-containing protein [Streptomyces cupreus]